MYVCMYVLMYEVLLVGSYLNILTMAIDCSTLSAMAMQQPHPNLTASSEVNITITPADFRCLVEDYPMQSFREV